MSKRSKEKRKKERAEKAPPTEAQVEAGAQGADEGAPATSAAKSEEPRFVEPTFAEPIDAPATIAALPADAPGAVEAADFEVSSSGYSNGAPLHSPHEDTIVSAPDDAGDAPDSEPLEVPAFAPVAEVPARVPPPAPVPPLYTADEILPPGSRASAYDFSEETFADIAPIGPTEHAQRTPTIAPESAAPVEPRSAPKVEQLEQQIRDLEARLDEMIDRSRERAQGELRIPPPSPSGVGSIPAPRASSSGIPAPRASSSGIPAPRASSPGIPAPRASSPGIPPAPQSEPGAPANPDDALDPARAATAREILSSEFYLRQWGRVGMRKRAEEVDDFGLDPQYEARFIPFFDFLYKHYFRVEAEGTQNIPAEGRCLVVSNHSGGPLPYDGLMLRTAVRREHAQQRELRWLAEDFIYYLPFVGTMMNRLGAVRACQENAERLLAQGRLVAVFPEGAKGIGKLYRDRYRLQRFGRGGFIRLCLRTQTPIIPSAIVGAEEANPMLYRIEYMTKALGIPYLPITPTFPALGPLGLLPAPTKWKIAFGEPLRFDGYGPEAADDEILVGRLAERVRATIQSMLDRMLSSRKSVWFG